MGSFLLHCDSGLKVAQIARLVGSSRPTASKQQGVSSKEAIQAAHHRMAGRPHGEKLFTGYDLPKEIRLADTHTVLKGEDPEQAVRTIIWIYCTWLSHARTADTGGVWRKSAIASADCCPSGLGEVWIVLVPD